MSPEKRTALFTEMLASLLDGGTTLSDSLRILSSTGMQNVVRQNAISVLDSMHKGNGFVPSLQKTNAQPLSGLRLFPSHIALLEVAQKTGTLPPILRDIVQDLRDRSRAREGFYAAIMYPLLVILIAFIGSILLYVKGLPLFVQNGLMDESTHATALQGLIFGLLFLVISGVGIFIWFNSLFGHDSPETTIFRILSFLMRHGVGLPEALDQCLEAVGNVKAERAVFLVKKGVNSGKSIAAAFKDTGFFAPFAIAWLTIARDNGNAISIFENLWSYYRNKNDQLRIQASRFIEPLIIVLTGVYLFILIQAVILPILTHSGGMYAL